MRFAMSPNQLSAIQERVLVALAALRPQWTLTGGGALVGFYTRHREPSASCACGSSSRR
jgi:hypothetical protein